jgi:hypothetical protein
MYVSFENYSSYWSKIILTKFLLKIFPLEFKWLLLKYFLKLYSLSLEKELLKQRVVHPNVCTVSPSLFHCFPVSMETVHENSLSPFF